MQFLIPTFPVPKEAVKFLWLQESASELPIHVGLRQWNNLRRSGNSSSQMRWASMLVLMKPGCKLNAVMLLVAPSLFASHMAMRLLAVLDWP